MGQLYVSIAELRVLQHEMDNTDDLDPQGHLVFQFHPDKNHRLERLGRQLPLPSHQGE
jgi:hypothetical protein